jgi:hypothetical protein
MAEAAVNTREELDAELDRLAAMLPVWREKLRVEAQFWPQFTALAGEVLAAADPDDLAHAHARIARMLAENGIAAEPPDMR